MVCFVIYLVSLPTLWARVERVLVAVGEAGKEKSRITFLDVTREKT